MITTKDRDDPYAAYDDADLAAGHLELAEPEANPEDHYVDNQGRPYEPPGWYVSDYERDADDEPTVDELLADHEVPAEADRILAGEDGTILGIPFAPSKRETERGE